MGTKSIAFANFDCSKQNGRQNTFNARFVSRAEKALVRVKGHNFVSLTQHQHPVIRGCGCVQFYSTCTYMQWRTRGSTISYYIFYYR